MSVSGLVLTGSLLLGQDVSWNGEHVLKDLCLYSADSTESSPFYNVSFVLEAIINLTAVKLFILRRERWIVGQIDSNENTNNFLLEVFNEEFNLCGTTSKALLIQVKSNDAFIDNLTLLVYGEKDLNSRSIDIYAQPLTNDMEYHSIYEMTMNDTTIKDKQLEQMILDEIFGIKYKYQHQSQDMKSSPDTRSPKFKLSELDMIKGYNPTLSSNRPIIKTTKGRVNKSIPTKYPHHTTSHHKKPIRHIPIKQHTLEERKMLLKKAIKLELVRQGKDPKNIELFQQVYTSVKYNYRGIIQSTIEINEKSLQTIVKMHVDFYLNMDSVINLTISK